MSEKNLEAQISEQLDKALIAEANREEDVRLAEQTARTARARRDEAGAEAQRLRLTLFSLLGHHNDKSHGERCGVANRDNQTRIRELQKVKE